MILRRIKSELTWQSALIRQSLAGRNTQVHPAPVLMVGNQKSGTTAIAALLSKMTGVPATLDLRCEMRRTVIPRVYKGRLTLDRLIQRNRLDFSRPIIKEPALTLLYPQLAERFPESCFVMILRDPRDNIRSILNRLNLAGDLNDISGLDYRKMSPAWRKIVDNRWLGLPGNNYIEMLSHRWNRMVQLYEQHVQRSLLMTYESFMQDKVSAICKLADQLEMDRKHDIGEYLDIRYQPTGDLHVTWQEFFADRNLERIERICGPTMERFGYLRSP